MFKNLTDLTKNVATNLKLRRKIAYTDNLVFRLHYRYTVGALIVSTILVSSRQYFGEHIRCIADRGVNIRVIETFCFFTNTFTVVKHHGGVDGMVPHPGVGPVNDDDAVIRHAYYQWVPYVLFLQAVMCFVPHFIWQQFEGGKIKSMTKCFQNAALASGQKPTKINAVVTIPSAEEQESKAERLCRAYVDRMHMNTWWALGLIMCEALNVVNIVVQVLLMQWFLGGRFMGLGDIMLGAEPDVERAMDIVFPKVTKCTFHKFGPSGSMQQHDALCVMALNVVNEKIYTFLWFWYIPLFALSSLVLLYRLVCALLYSHCSPFNRCIFRLSCPNVSLRPKSLDTVTSACSYADWMFLRHLAKSLDDFVFSDLLDKLAAAVDAKKLRNVNNHIDTAVNNNINTVDNNSDDVNGNKAAKEEQHLLEVE